LKEWIRNIFGLCDWVLALRRPKPSVRHEGFRKIRTC
jgi:hypothetical protein